jgi:NitT/TauT family transport system substrate-binding protein
MSKFTQYKTILTIITGLVLCVTGLFWPRVENRRPLTVAVNIWPGTEGLLTAREHVRTKDERINFVEMSWSTAAMGAFHRRVVDAAILTPDELLRLEEGARPRAVLILGVSRGADAILARPGFKSIPDIRGKRVGVELRSMAEYLLLHALEANGMTLQDVELVPLNMAETESAYDEGDVDAVVAADPWRVRLKDKGAVVLFDSSDMGLELSRVLVVREDALADYPHEVRSLVEAHLHQASFLNGMVMADGLDAILRREGLTHSQWHQALDAIQFPSAAENLRLMKPGAGSLEECMTRMTTLMQRGGLLPLNTKARALLRPELVEELVP